MKTWTPQSMGEKGGTKSRRTLSHKEAKRIVQIREDKRKKKKPTTFNPKIFT